MILLPEMNSIVRKILLVQLFMASICLVSCKNDPQFFLYPTCPEGYIDIDDIYDIDSTITSCFDMNIVLEDEYIINDDSTYQVVLKFKTNSNSCSNWSLPPIDFTQRSLLGKFAEGGGCTGEFFRKVCKSELEKTLKYIIKVREESDCMVWRYSMNWMAVPKIPGDYKIIFEVQ